MYLFGLYYVLFGGANREMVVVSESMLEGYNYWNSVNLVPFKTISEYLAALTNGSVRGHAIRNLLGNLLLLFPMGFYLPFFARKTEKTRLYCITLAAVILVVELVQLATMSGSLDIDDFLINLAGALLGHAVFTRTSLRRLHELRSW